MSVILYTGLMGSGKSYSAVENVILQCLRDKRTIVTNMVLQKSVIFEEFPDANITTMPDDIKIEDRDVYFNLDRFPAGAVFIIDEAGELFPSGEKQSVVSQSLKQFFTKHRHSVGLDGKSSEIVLMTQGADQLASWVRGLCDTQYNHVKLDKHGAKNSFRVDIYERAHTGMNIPEKYKLKSATGSYKSEVFKYYKSHTQNKSDFESGLEVKADKRGNFLHVYRDAILAVIALPFLVWFAVSALGGMFSDGSENLEDKDGNTVIEESATEKEIKKPEQVMREMIAQALPAYQEDPFMALPESESFKLVGTIRSSRGMTAILRSKKVTYEVNALRQCSYREMIKEWVCVMGGELIASHTGPSFDESESEDLGDVFSFGDD